MYKIYNGFYFISILNEILFRPTRREILTEAANDNIKDKNLAFKYFEYAYTCKGG